MRPATQDFGRHDQFWQYKSLFYQWYGQGVTDVLGHIVRFDKGDCAHVCYGGQRSGWYKSDNWNHLRAIRIPWIHAALTAPTRIHRDKDYEDRLKYLLVVDPVRAGEPKEFYCLLTQVVDDNASKFITAFDLSEAQYAAAKKILPCYYPVPNTTADTKSTSSS